MHATIAPLARIVAEELSAKFETAIGLSFDELFAADLSGRARAFRSLVTAAWPLKRPLPWPGSCNPKNKRGIKMMPLNGPVCQSSLGRHFSNVHFRIIRLSASGWRRAAHCRAACEVWKPRASL